LTTHIQNSRIPQPAEQPAIASETFGQVDSPRKSHDFRGRVTILSNTQPARLATCRPALTEHSCGIPRSATLRQPLAKRREDAIYLHNQIVKDQSLQPTAAKQLSPNSIRVVTTPSG
jgi:hypothetical protein